MSFYKTNNPAVLAAWEDERVQRTALKVEVDAFADRFGGQGLVYANPGRFAGLRFSEPPPRDLWITPDSNGLQWPRQKPLKGASVETKAALKALNAEWIEFVPRGRVSADGVFKALGFNNSLDFIFEGLTLFVHAGFLYARTSKAMPSMTEILGSEYETAHQALNQGGAA